MRIALMLGSAVTAAAAVAALAGCSISDGGSAARNAAAAATSAKAGTVLDTPFAKPALTLTDQDGKRFDLVEATKGRPTLLFFGYTHCPDVCPTTMGDIAVAKSRLPTAEQARLKVVFVTTDPERDTPQRLKSWLAAFDPSFIGLSGDFTAIQAAGRSVGVGIDKPVKEKDGSVSVTHGAEVLAFLPTDDKAHVLYMSGTTADQFGADLPKIVKGRTP